MVFLFTAIAAVLGSVLTYIVLKCCCKPDEDDYYKQ